MNFDSLEDRELETWITESLRSIREAALAGLDEQEALQRAQRLNALIVEGRISDAEIELDDTFKDVLYALVYRVLNVRDGEPDKATRHAMAIYDFIHKIPWNIDDLDEKQELLNDCAAAGARHRAGNRAGVGACGEAVCIDSGNSSSSAGETEPTEDSGQTKTQRVFDSALPVVHAILVELYQFSESEARRLERELLAFFARFCRRTGNRRSRAVLLAATSEIARQYRRFQETSLESPAPIEARLQRLLHRALNEADRESAWGGKRGSGG